ncbi:uncharacterized protein [Centroberyx affinis]|uniref:uncharacterized protein n=1 Tax=Centroberyx affinis TaxID=166261 RepID=UPI003A5BD688
MTSVYRDMFTLCATVLLSFMSVSHSAPLSCEDLLRPLDQLEPHHLEGRWALVAGSMNHSPSLEVFKSRDSAAIHFSNSSANSTATSYTRTIRSGSTCQYRLINISVEGSTFIFESRNHFNLSWTFLHTSCPDCIMIRWNVELERQSSYLFSRRREVGPEEMEEYKAQLECLKLPPPVVMDPTKELCPEQTPSEPAAAQTGEKTDEQKA